MISTHKLDKKSFINQTKIFTKKSLYQVINSYRDDKVIEPDSPLFQLIDDFFSIEQFDIKKYQALEIEITNFLKDKLQSRSHRSSHLKPLFGVLYYLIGTCQLAQEKNIEAQINFHQSYHFSRSIEIELMSLLSNTYNCLLNPTTDNLIKAEYFFNIFKHQFADTDFRNELENNDEFKASKPMLEFYDIIETQIVSYSKKNRDIKIKQNEIKNLHELFADWRLEKNKERPNEIRLKEIQEKLIHSKCFSYTCREITDNNMLLSFFACAITDKLKACTSNKKNRNKKNIKNIEDFIEGFIIEAMKQNLRFPILINLVINKIEESENPSLHYQRLKKALENISQQIKSNDILYCLFHGDKDINYSISQLSPQNRLNAFKQDLVNEPYIKDANDFIKEAKCLAEPALKKVCNAIKPEELKKQCDAIINQFLKTEITLTDYENLYKDCTERIVSLFKNNIFANINQEHGPLLDVLYYVAGICELAICDHHNTHMEPFYLNESLYQPSLEMADHLHFARAYLRFRTGWFFGGQYDLNKLSNTFPDNTLQKIVNNLIAKYSKKNPMLILTEDEKIKTLLNKLKIAILENKNPKAALELQATYESYDPFIIPLSQEEEYNFLMTLLFLDLHVKTTHDDKNIYDLSLATYLNETLTRSSDRLKTLFKFVDFISSIYGEKDKTYIYLLYTYNKKLIQKTGEVMYDSFIFEKFVLNYCKEIIPVSKEVSASPADLINNTQVENKNENMLARGDEKEQIVLPDGVINKEYFIKQSKQLVGPYLSKIKNESVDEDVIKLINDFYNISDNDFQQYNKIEEAGINLLKVLLQRSRNFASIFSSDHWYPVIGALYYIVGTCQLAQNKNLTAQFYFDEAFKYGNNIEIQIISNLSNVVATLSSNTTTSNLIKAKCYFHNKNNFLTTNEELKKLHTLLFDKVNTDSTINVSTTEKVKGLVAANSWFSAWRQASDENIEKLYLDGLSKHLAYLNADDILYIFKRIIMSQLKKNLTYRKHKQLVNPDLKLAIGKFIVEANKYILFSSVLKTIIKELMLEDSRDAFIQIYELKLILEELNITDSLLHGSVYQNKDINSVIFDLSPINSRPPFNLTIKNEQFVNESKPIAQPILMELYESVLTNKDVCKTLIDKFMVANKKEDYEKLFNACNSIIKVLFVEKTLSDIKKDYGPILDILYYLAAISQIAIAHDNNRLGIAEMNLNEGLYQPSSIAIQDLLLATRVFTRFSRGWIHGGISDLNEISKNSTCDILRNKLKDEVTQFTSLYPSTILEKNVEVETLLNQLSCAVLKNDNQAVRDLEKDFEKRNEKRIYGTYVATFYFWMTIHYLKLLGKSGEGEKSKYSERLSIYLKKALVSSDELVKKTLFDFETIISIIFKDNDKYYIKLLNDERLKLENQNNNIFKHFCSSLIYAKHVSEYCKDLDYKDSETILQETKEKVETQTSTPNLKTSPDPDAPQKDAQKQMIDEVIIVPIEEPETQPKEEKDLDKNTNKENQPKKKKRKKKKQFTKQEQKKLNTEITKTEKKQAKLNKIDDDTRVKKENLMLELSLKKEKLRQTDNKIATIEKMISLKEKEILDKQSKANTITKNLEDLNRTILKLDDLVRQLLTDKIRKKNDEMLTIKEKKEKAESILSQINDAEQRVEEIKNMQVEIAKEESKVEGAKAEIGVEIAKVENEIKESRLKIQRVKERILLKDEEIRREIRKIEVELLSPYYLLQHFSDPDDYNKLSFLNRLAQDLGRPIVGKGSFFNDFYIGLIHKDLANKKIINDIDISIDCIDTNVNYDNLLEKLKKEGFEVINSGDAYINLQSPELKNGLKIDLTLKIGYDRTIDPFPITRGEFLLVFPENKYPFFKMIENKSFDDACFHKKTRLDLPALNTKNYNYRCLYKGVNGYRDIIKIVNIREARCKLYEYYIQTLAENRITIYLELSEFVKRGALDVNDRNAFKLLKLTFNAFFHSKAKRVDVKEFVTFFIDCKDDLYYENKNIFKAQIDLMLDLYLEKQEPSEIRNKINGLKLLYLESKDDLCDANKKVLNDQIDLMIRLYLEKRDQNEIKNEIKNLKLLYLKSIEPQQMNPQQVLQTTYEHQHKILQITHEYHTKMLQEGYEYQQKMMLQAPLINNQQQILNPQSSFNPNPHPYPYSNPDVVLLPTSYNLYPNPFGAPPIGYNLYPNPFGPPPIGYNPYPTNPFGPPPMGYNPYPNPFGPLPTGYNLYPNPFGPLQKSDNLNPNTNPNLNVSLKTSENPIPNSNVRLLPVDDPNPNANPTSKLPSDNPNPTVVETLSAGKFPHTVTGNPSSLFNRPASPLSTDSTTFLSTRPDTGTQPANDSIDITSEEKPIKKQHTKENK